MEVDKAGETGDIPEEIQSFKESETTEGKQQNEDALPLFFLQPRVPDHMS